MDLRSCSVLQKCTHIRFSRTWEQFSASSFLFDRRLLQFQEVRIFSLELSWRSASSLLRWRCDERTNFTHFMHACCSSTSTFFLLIELTHYYDCMPKRATTLSILNFRTNIYSEFNYLISLLCMRKTFSIHMLLCLG